MTTSCLPLLLLLLLPSPPPLAMAGRSSAACKLRAKEAADACKNALVAQSVCDVGTGARGVTLNLIGNLQELFAHRNLRTA